MELEIIQHLISNPRCPSNKLAKMISRSTKGVRMAINRLIHSGSIFFTTRCKFPKYFVIIQNENGYLSLGETIESLNKEFNCIWEIFVSSIESMIYLTFAVDEITKINQIHDKIRNNPALTLQDTAICEPTLYYNNRRQEMLAYFIENGQLPQSVRF